ncbi:hypothetical protein GOV11_04875 [Candidatus Woesearchaeota archaeon]|nr:hypothetical protein [Candidatus Woesearchaeota archaeon]
MENKTAHILGVEYDPIRARWAEKNIGALSNGRFAIAGEGKNLQLYGAIYNGYMEPKEVVPIVSSLKGLRLPRFIIGTGRLQFDGSNFIALNTDSERIDTELLEQQLERYHNVYIHPLAR